jgi:hypothetical protein
MPAPPMWTEFGLELPDDSVAWSLYHNVKDKIESAFKEGDKGFISLKGGIPLKGESFLETGYVYAPYIPLQTTSVIALDEFKKNKVNTKIHCSKKIINPKFFAKGIVTA